MTKNQARKKTRYLIREAANLMREKLEKALVCGALDFDAYGDNYELPRIIVCALLKDADFNLRPIAWKEKEQKAKNEEIQNLYSML